LPAQIWKSFTQSALAGQHILPLPGADQIEPDVPSDSTATSAFDDLLSRIVQEQPESPAQN
jgi:hypothetical protein